MKLLFLALLLTILVPAVRPNTCYYRRQVPQYYSRWKCVCHFAWWCSHHAWVTQSTLVWSTFSKCCLGYTGPSCQTPICSPSCSHGGKCVSPNVCQCPDGFTGKSCQTETCSYLKPCFPGYCTWPNTCHCQNGFSGPTCANLTSSQTPEVLQSRSEFIRIRRSNDKELYRYIVDATMPNLTETEYMWTNQNIYNYLNITIESMFHAPEAETNPNYVTEHKFGIISGDAEVTLTKIPRKGQSKPFTALNKRYNCSNSGGPNDPEIGVFMCNIKEENFATLIEHGDNLTVSVTTTNGGYRKLKNTNTNRYYNTEIYHGHSSYKSMQLQFDFYPPYNCLENKTCHATPLKVSDEITKEPFNITWEGWKDDVSGVATYTWKVFNLVPNNYTQNLTEKDPKHSIYEQEIAVENLTSFPSYTPPESGMYSILLGVSDEANNTRYARRLVLYDNTSRVSIDETSPMFVATAARETRYRWQSNLTGPITITWTSHFINQLHDKKKLLNPVDSFQTQTFVHDMNFVTKVDHFFEDNQGQRSLKGIPNKHGIVRFEYSSKAVNGSVKGNVSLPVLWHNVSGGINETQSVVPYRRDGDTIRTWVRATDIMGNQEIDTTDVHFDSTKPIIRKINFLRNVNSSSFNFSSRLTFLAFDEDSGIFHIHWKLVANDTDKIFHEGFLNGNKTSKTNVQLPEGKCIPPTQECFFFLHHFEINNCWLVVEKEKLHTQVVRLELTAYNQAMLPASQYIEIENLTEFEGIDEYSGPMNLRVTKRYSNGVRLKWDIAPSCYKRTDITVSLVDENGNPQKRHISPDADWFDLIGLQSTMNYSLQFMTQYGDQESAPKQLSFITSNAEETSASLSVGAKAGIGIGVVILVIICVTVSGVLLMWKRRKQCAKNDWSMRQTRHHVENTYIEEKPTKQQNMGFNNGAYNKCFEEDDVYLYGNMEFGNEGWVIKHNQVTLEDKITSGRFAEIFKAKYRPLHGKSKTVVAKVLKSNHNETDILLMKAKVNFHATQIGNHKQVLDFLGAVRDNPALGVYMLLEFCEIGPMRDWLLKQKRKVTDDVIEHLYRICLEIAKGMEYLAEKKVVHRKLAARNVLLNFSLEAKVSGFGPTLYDTGKDDTGHHERLPLKWLAPECMKSSKDATSQSDVWSYGVVLWEMFACGDTPYAGMQSKDVESKIKSGFRMDKPEFSSEFHYDLMKRCWSLKPHERPTFVVIRKELETMFHEAPTDDYYYYTRK